MSRSGRNKPVCHSQRRSLLVACALGLLGGALGAPAIAADSAPTVQVTDAWIRWLPAGLPAVGYATLANSGDKAMVLTSASSPDYGNTTLHLTIDKGGVSKMVHPDKITIPPHETVRFAPGGYHIMLMQPKKDVKPGDRVPIALGFADGRTIRVEFEVLKADAVGPSGMKGMSMHDTAGMQHQH
ncbi:hypothetical protein GALL_233740 [mine drainage metagenome]|uniref:Copper chaperone PCu(A)C n=1 Tax=mine drainage metagenome TaxID=410659 RepID=A0A1J5RGS7_9ZZZZ